MAGLPAWGLIQHGNWATQFQDVAGTQPITAAGQQIARVNPVIGYNAGAWTQTPGVACPVAQAGYSDLDGTAQFWNGDAATLDIMRNRAAGFYAERLRVSSLTVINMVAAWSPGAVGTSRFRSFINTNGAYNLQYRRLDADTTFNATTAASQVVVATQYVVAFCLDWAGAMTYLWISTGAGNLTASRAAAASTSAGLTSDTASVRARLGASDVPTATQFQSGRSYSRLYAADYVPNTAQVAQIADLLWAA